MDRCVAAPCRVDARTWRRFSLGVLLDYREVDYRALGNGSLLGEQAEGDRGLEGGLLGDD